MATRTIGTLSREAGCNVETIRYYERIGLLPPPPRSTGGHRLYEDHHAKRLDFIRRSRAMGFPLGQVRSLLEFVDDGADACAEVRALATIRLETVRHRLEDLRRLETTLQAMILECNGGDAPGCPILDALHGARLPGG